MQNTHPRSRRDERGAALLEFALVMPVFVFILYALIAFGMAVSTKHNITNAASEGARAAIGAPDYTTAKSQATSRVTTVLGAANGRYTVTMPASATACGTHSCIEVTVTWDYAGHPVVPSAPGLGVVMPNNLTSKAVVQYS
jgi:Flp pilus assembly protein TadG